MYTDLKQLYYHTNITIFSCAVAYIVERGTEMVKQLTDDDIKNVQGNGLMTAEYCQAIMRTSRDIVNKLDTPTELIQFCDAIGFFGIEGYSNGESCDRATLERAVQFLARRELYGDTVEIKNVDELAEYLDMETEELWNIMES